MPQFGIPAVTELIIFVVLVDGVLPLNQRKVRQGLDNALCEIAVSVYYRLRILYGRLRWNGYLSYTLIRLLYHLGSFP